MEANQKVSMERKGYRYEEKDDPVTGLHYWKTHTFELPPLDEERRISLVLDILGGKASPEEVRKNYSLASVNSVYTWIGKYVSQSSSLSLHESNEEDMSAKSKDDQIKDLKAQLKQAWKEAELEKLRAKAYDTMINVAEETFNIPIRKKIWHQTESLLRNECPEYGLGTLCGLFGYSRRYFESYPSCERKYRG